MGKSANRLTGCHPSIPVAKHDIHLTHIINERSHESLDNLTPSDFQFRRTEEVKSRREEIKQATLEKRHSRHRQSVKDRLYWKGESSLNLIPEMSH